MKKDDMIVCLLNERALIFSVEYFIFQHHFIRMFVTLQLNVSEATDTRYQNLSIMYIHTHTHKYKPVQEKRMIKSNFNGIGG